MTDNTSTSRPWEALPKWSRRAISAWLVFHLIAVVSAPASVAPASDLARTCWTICRPYLQTLYLNHGYHYFAPDPGESTLLAFTIEQADGTTTQDVIPNRRIWPRLLYHRHFMLTESLAMVAGVSERRLPATDALDEPAQPDAHDLPGQSQRDEASFEEVSLVVDEDPAQEHQRVAPPPEGLLRDWYASYARCILEHSAAERVRLTRVIHYLPRIEWMQESIALGEPLTLSEPQSFSEFPIGTFTRDGLTSGPEPMPGNDPTVPLDERTREPSDLVLTRPHPGGRP